MKENETFREETSQKQREIKQEQEMEQNQGEKKRENKRTLWYGYIGAAAVVLFIICGIIWQASGKTISETGRELEARKTTENAGKKEKGEGEKATGGSIQAAIGKVMDEPVKTVTGAAFAANTKREELLAQQAAAAEEAARKKAEEEAAMKAEEAAKAKAEEKARIEAQKAAQRAEAENSGWNEGEASSEPDNIPSASEPAQPIEWNVFTDEVIRLVNVERANVGLPPLVKNEKACQAAEKRAAEIGISFSHTRPDGRACYTILDDMGIGYVTCGENIASGHPTAAAVVRGWMNSPGHRANILNEDYAEIGVGVWSVDGILHWTQLFLRADW